MIGGGGGSGSDSLSAASNIQPTRLNEGSQSTTPQAGAVVAATHRARYIGGQSPEPFEDFDSLEEEASSGARLVASDDLRNEQTSSGSSSISISIVGPSRTLVPAKTITTRQQHSQVTANEPHSRPPNLQRQKQQSPAATATTTAPTLVVDNNDNDDGELDSRQKPPQAPLRQKHRLKQKPQPHRARSNSSASADSLTAVSHRPSTATGGGGGGDTLLPIRRQQQQQLGRAGSVATFAQPPEATTTVHEDNTRLLLLSSSPQLYDAANLNQAPPQVSTPSAWFRPLVLVDSPSPAAEDSDQPSQHRQQIGSAGPWRRRHQQRPASAAGAASARTHHQKQQRRRRPIRKSFSTSSIFALYASRYAREKFHLALRTFKAWYHEQLTYHHLSSRMEFNQQAFEQWYRGRGKPLQLRALDRYDQIVIWIAGEFLLFKVSPLQALISSTCVCV